MRTQSVSRHDRLPRHFTSPNAYGRAPDSRGGGPIAKCVSEVARYGKCLCHRRFGSHGLTGERCLSLGAWRRPSRWVFAEVAQPTWFWEALQPGRSSMAVFTGSAAHWSKKTKEWVASANGRLHLFRAADVSSTAQCRRMGLEQWQGGSHRQSWCEKHGRLSDEGASGP